MNNYTWTLDDSQYLAHFGILGMKWGVRRYQNADGTYTAAGRNRYFGGGSSKTSGGSGGTTSRNSKATKQSDAYLMDVAKAKKEGKSDAEAQAIAERNRKIRKALAITAGVAVAAAVAYAGTKYYKNNIADVIVGTASEPLKRIQTFDGIHNADGAIYAANAKDNVRYIDWWGRQQDTRLRQLKKFAQLHGVNKDILTQDVYNMNLVFNDGKGVKVASTPHAKKIFNKLMKNDPQFKAQVNTLLKNGTNIPGVDDTYEAFNVNLYGKNKNSEVAKKFYKALKDAGYGGVKDVNDNKYSGYRTKSAAILFDGKYDWSARKLNPFDYAYAARDNEKLEDELFNEDARKETAKIMAVYAGMFGGAAAVNKAVSSTKANRALSMRNAGVPVSKIASQLGISESEVYRLTPKFKSNSNSNSNSKSNEKK